MRRSWLSKREFYSRPDVAREYDRQRFGGLSGARVNERELEIVESLLPPSGRVLDLACGTGRLTHRLAARGYDVVALDSSPAMLRHTLSSFTSDEPALSPGLNLSNGLSKGPTPDPVASDLSSARGVRKADPPPSALLADAFHLPFRDGTLDAVVAMRLFFHYPDVGPIATEMARVCRPAGALVFDTASWSPRSTFALAAGRWGGKVFAHRPAELIARLGQVGLQVTARQDAFLVSPYLYRLLPPALERRLEALEAKLPAAWRSRVIWQAWVAK
jgi:ubiquinone/menaquinone biosynthesis C-methylase UbiE